ncbi:hypothetical protein L1987_52426 [Smallanthus sonchifolius]|uniref:Uncharacterized protein n=1 Tax=Smallanthus sonchifolius TaxID=185202 RepID=A0ACB9ETT6_9ASTR|nr:hypothetical protein L1987_52426 [Smallanthus sonchifolius]
MSRVIRVTKDERGGPVLKHVDSPRPFIQQTPIQYDRKDQNLVKTRKISSAVKKVKETSRFSCDERESQYSLKSSFKVKELPRLSLDSKQNSKTNSMNESRSEPGSNKRPSSGIVARLMGLDSLTDSICEVETVKIKQAFGDQLGSSSPRVYSKIKPALQPQESGDSGSKKPSVYGEMEKRLRELGFETSGEDLRVLKHIVEAMQMKKTVFDNKEQSLDSPKNDQPGSPTVKGPNSPKRRELLNRAVTPAKTATKPVMVTGLHYVNRKARKQTRHLKIKPINPMQNNDQSCMQSYTVNSCKSESKQEIALNNFKERLIEDKPMVELVKLTTEQASPVSVLDAFYVEDMPSPVKKKPNAFNDYDNLRIDETEWNQVGIYNLVTHTDAGEFHQTELLNSADGEIAKSPCKRTNVDHNYIREILLASGFLKDPDSAIRIAELHSTGSLIKPELFHILEKTKDECHKKNPRSKSNENVRRKLIFDSVNDILFHKLAMSSLSGKRCGRSVDGEKLLTELWLEIDSLQSSSERGIYDEDDEVKVHVSADVNKNSQDWNMYCYEVPSLVLDIERLIFKDLIDEIVNADARGVQDGLGRHCRRLFSM